MDKRVKNDYMTIKTMLKYAKKVLEYTNNTTFEKFQSDEKTQEACVFNLLQLGEQANTISSDFELFHNNIPWRQIYGMRNHIVHDYEGINLNLVWKTITHDIPTLVNSFEKLLQKDDNLCS